jgi:hypothetical protein
MFYDGRIPGVGDLFDDQVGVIVEVRHLELERVTDFCSATARCEQVTRVAGKELTAEASQPRPPG